MLHGRLLVVETLDSSIHVRMAVDVSSEPLEVIFKPLHFSGYV